MNPRIEAGTGFSIARTGFLATMTGSLTVRTGSLNVRTGFAVTGSLTGGNSGFRNTALNQGYIFQQQTYPTPLPKQTRGKKMEIGRKKEAFSN